jgi:hypothetical protein
VPAVFSPDVLISERFTESGFDDFRRAVVTVFEKVTVDTEGDGGGGMAKPPADGNRVHASGNQLARMGVAESVQAYCRQLEFG